MQKCSVVIFHFTNIVHIKFLFYAVLEKVMKVLVLNLANKLCLYICKNCYIVLVLVCAVSFRSIFEIGSILKPNHYGQIKLLEILDTQCMFYKERVVHLWRHNLRGEG